MLPWCSQTYCPRKWRWETPHSANASTYYHFKYLSLLFEHLKSHKKAPKKQQTNKNTTKSWNRNPQGFVFISIRNIKEEVALSPEMRLIKGRLVSKRKWKKKKSNKTKGKRLKETSFLQPDCLGIVPHMVNSLWSWNLCIFSLCQTGKRGVPCGNFSHMELFRKKKKTLSIKISIPRNISLEKFITQSIVILFTIPDSL